MIELKELALIIEKSGYDFSDIKLKVLIKVILNKIIENDLLTNFQVVINPN